MNRRRIDTTIFKPNHRAKAWCATLNNARVKDVHAIREILLHEACPFLSDEDGVVSVPVPGRINKKNRFTYFIAGIEHGPLRPNDWVTPEDYSGDGNTPHLQCAWQTYTDISWAKMIDHMNTVFAGQEHHPMFSVFPCNGSDDDQVEYCSKEGDVVIQWGVRETIPRATASKQGKRSDLEDIRDELKKGTAIDELRDRYFSQFAQFDRYFTNYSGRILEAQAKERLSTSFDSITWKPWQKTILQKVLDPTLSDVLPVKPRSLICVVDHVGRSGKSYLSTFLALKHGFLVVNPCGKRDLAYILTQALASGISPRGVILDVARSTVGTGLQEGQHLAPNQALSSAFNFIEAIHDQRIVNTKYEAKTVFFDPMHTLLFTNHELETRSEYTLSRDRWDVMHLRAGVLCQTTGGQWD